MKTHVVQSISGGMDSTCLLLRHLAQNRSIHLLSFDYGQKHKLELERLDKNLEYLKAQDLGHTRISVPFGGIASSALTTAEQDVPEGFYAQDNMKQTVVPNRNAIFSAIAYASALSLANELHQEVLLSLGVHSGDHAIYPDCRREFFEALHAAFVLGNWNGQAVILDLPYLDWDKVDILRQAVKDCETLGIEFDTVLRNTNTSYAPDVSGKASGRTGSDVERILAFHVIGRRDPVEYIDGWEKALEYALQSQKDFNMKG